MHTPLTPETTHIINKDTIALMKPDAVLINTSRGPVVDEAALYQALKEHRIFGAGLDVFWNEPPDIADPILHHPLITTTPHVGGVTDASFQGAVDFIVENIKRLSDGREPCSCLNVQDINRRKTL